LRVSAPQLAPPQSRERREQRDVTATAPTVMAGPRVERPGAGEAWHRARVPVGPPSTALPAAARVAVDAGPPGQAPGGKLRLPPGVRADGRHDEGGTVRASAIAAAGMGARLREDDGMPLWLGQAPDWRSKPPAPEVGRPEPLAPSKPEGVELGTVPAAASPLAERAGAGDRFRRGLLLHTLMQHLPELPEAGRAAAARTWLDRPGQRLPGDAAATLVAEALAILVHPDLAPACAPGSRAEVPLTGMVGTQVVGGLVDRLAVLPDRVLVVDFKTNRLAPDRPEDTPVMYLRQMAAYRAVLRGIFPDREIRCALVWTRAARVAMLPDALLDAHAPDARQVA
jgi:hypothetical protein